MADEIEIEGIKYISSKRASELSGYAQDYIGQLARGGYIDARRIGGLWHVSLVSLEEYGKSAGTYKPKPPERVRTASDPDSLVSFDGRDHISAARAAKLTGYHQDYVGQLARSGTVPSRQVGNRWYVEREAILAHKNEKDRLLGAVQARSVGLAHRSAAEDTFQPEDGLPAIDFAEGAYTYTTGTEALFPEPAQANEGASIHNRSLQGAEESTRYAVPIRVVQEREILDHGHHVKYVNSAVRRPRKTIFYGTIGVVVFTVVITLSLGFWSIRKSSTYAVDAQHPTEKIDRGLLTTSVANALVAAGDLLERLLVPELIYKRVE